MKITDEQLKKWKPKGFWEAYKLAVYSNPLCQKQEKECSRSFYAGMHAAAEFQLMVAGMKDEEAAMKCVDSFHKELVAVTKTQASEVLNKRRKTRDHN